MPEQAAK